MTAYSNLRNTTFNKELNNVFQSNGIWNHKFPCFISKVCTSSPTQGRQLQTCREGWRPWFCLSWSLSLSCLLTALPLPQPSKPGNPGQNVSDLKTLELFPNSNFNLSFRSYILGYHSGILWINSSYFFKLLAQNIRKFLKQYFHFLLSWLKLQVNILLRTYSCITRQALSCSHLTSDILRLLIFSTSAFPWKHETHPCLCESLSLLQDISEFQILGHNLMQLLDLAMLY